MKNATVLSTVLINRDGILNLLLLILIKSLLLRYNTVSDLLSLRRLNIVFPMVKKKVMDAMSNSYLLTLISIGSFHEYTLFILKPIKNQMIRAHCTRSHHIIMTIKNIHDCVPVTEFRCEFDLPFNSIHLVQTGDTPF